MTIDEYRYYSKVVLRLFDYMNGEINTMNSQCDLCINMYDFVSNTIANIRYPNHIIINLGTIIDLWNDDWYSVMNKHDYIGTCIAWALSHELHHADQLISMVMYNSNPDYKNSVEGDVERASYDWVASHAKEISFIGNFNVVIKNLQSPTLPKEGNYRKATVKEFYIQTIANIILRDLDLFGRLDIFTNDTKADTINIIFNLYSHILNDNKRIYMDHICIKDSGKYLEQNLNRFSQLAYEYAGYFDKYKVDMKIAIVKIRNKKFATVTFEFTDSWVTPLIQKD